MRLRAAPRRDPSLLSYNLNRMIDVNYYPIPEAPQSNFRHPIGIGVQGLVDTFMALCMSFDSPEVRELNVQHPGLRNDTPRCARGV